MLGDSLNPPDMETINNIGKYFANDLRDAPYVVLTQTDRKSNMWEDQWGYSWTQNGHGTWLQLERDEFERFADAPSTVMTRTNSNYVTLVQYESDRAYEFAEQKYPYIYDEPFDSLEEAFSYHIVPKADKMSDPTILYNLKVQEEIAIEKLKSRPGATHHN